MHNVVARIAAALIEALLPEIKNDLNSLRETVDETINQQNEVIRTLNETVARELEEHRSEMATYHSETETKLEDLQTSLQFVIDNPPIEAIGTRVVLLLLPYLNDNEHDKMKSPEVGGHAQ